MQVSSFLRILQDTMRNASASKECWNMGAETVEILLSGEGRRIEAVCSPEGAIVVREVMKPERKKSNATH